jgi:hypothetical protein
MKRDMVDGAEDAFFLTGFTGFSGFNRMRNRELGRRCGGLGDGVGLFLRGDGRDFKWVRKKVGRAK